MDSTGPTRVLRAVSILLMVVAVPGFIVMLVMNAFFLDDYNAYGEVSIPGTGSVHLPRGEVTISFHTVVVGSPNGGLPVPPLGITFAPPDGVAQPTVTENFGSTTTVNNDAHVRVWTAQIPADATYNVTTDGQVNGFINPRLAFGHSNALGFLVWVFVGMFFVGLVGTIAAGMLLSRGRRKARAAVVAGPSFVPPPFPPPVPHMPPLAPPVVTTAPSGPSAEGVRLERLKTLASLRDSGALTEEEFQTEKRRILDGD
jgi:Short C-terminal domain